jgi:RimJ/RimL family protein N-acetyltransferase
MTLIDVSLERWTWRHKDAFAALCTDPEVMADLGGPIDRAQSDEKFERYDAAWRQDGISRWAVVGPSGPFLG